jgi:hypothetical protein
MNAILNGEKNKIKMSLKVKIIMQQKLAITEILFDSNTKIVIVIP